MCGQEAAQELSRHSTTPVPDGVPAKKRSRGQVGLVCSTCGKRYGRLDNLQRHISSIHEGTKRKRVSERGKTHIKLECKHCGTSVAGNHMARHIDRWHTDGRKKCTMCAKKIKLSYMQEHMEARHRQHTVLLGSRRPRAEADEIGHDDDES